MRFLSSVLVCIGALYAVDSIWFGGWYFSVVDQMMNQALALNW